MTTDPPKENSRRRKVPLAERLNRELSEHGGGNVADERSDLLRDQAKAKGAEHRRRVAEREAAQAAKGVAAQAVVVEAPAAPTVAPLAPDRALSRQERHEAEELAANRRTIWLPQPVTAPGTNMRIHGYDPLHVPDWLQEVLDGQLAA